MISIIMSTYNEKINWINQSIDSILNQTNNDFEFIIVLDNPNNLQIENIVNTYAEKDPRIKIIKNKGNLGLVASLNKALEVARGKYIMRMDADDISEKDRIEKELKFLEDNDFDIVSRRNYPS